METIVNKKRIWGIVSLIIIIGLMFTPIAYADTDDEMNANAGAQTAKELNLKQSYPENNDTKLQIENTGIKLFFDGNVIDKSVWENNKKCFTLTDKKGKEIKTRAYASYKSGTDYILVVVQSGQTLKSKTDYVFTVNKGLQSQEGQVLSQNITLNYTTVDTEGNSRINMGLMALMVVGMIVMTVVSNKRAEQKKAQKKEEKVDVYKVAKEKGKSVEEVVEKMEKDKARKAKRLKGKSDDDETEEDDSDVYNVKRARKVSEGGSTYKTGRKALAEKKAREEAAKKAKGTTNPKNKNNKNKKKGKKKK